VALGGGAGGEDDGGEDDGGGKRGNQDIRGITDTAEPRVPDIVIETVSFDTTPNGRIALIVRGRARRLGPHATLYAIAQPGAADASTDSSRPQRWFASAPTTPGRQGVWSARIRVDPPPRPFTVQTVQLRSPRKKNRIGTLPSTTTSPPSDSSTTSSRQTPGPSEPPLDTPADASVPFPAPRERDLTPRRSLEKFGPAAARVRKRSVEFAAAPPN
jgi:hypothetical protein